MTSKDPNVGLVELVAEELGGLRDELMLVGGCAVGLLITDTARPPIRQTVDVDLVAEVASITAYYDVERKLTERGFHPQPEVICRWTKNHLIVDVMSAVDIGHNFMNPWYAPAAEHSTKMTLSTGREIRMITAPYFLATKLVSFNSRGGGNYAHHDIEDIVNLVDGRVELMEEVEKSEANLREFIMDEFDQLLADERFTEQLPWHLNPDESNQARVSLLIGRMRKLAGL